MIELVAVVSMIIDHVGFVFFPEMIIFQIIGRLSFPLYAYLIALGYSRTKNSIIYFFRVLVLAIVSQWFFNYLISPIKLNVCFTLSFSIISLIVFESNRINKVLKLFLYILILFLALLLGCEYGSYGILLVLLFHLYIRNQHDKTYKIYAITSIILLIIVSMFVFSFSIIHLYSILSLPIILLTPKNIQKIKVNSIKHINPHAGAAPAQIEMKTEAAKFPVFCYTVLEGRHTTKHGRVSCSQLYVCKTVY